MVKSTYLPNLDYLSITFGDGKNFRKNITIFFMEFKMKCSLQKNKSLNDESLHFPPAQGDKRYFLFCLTKYKSQDNYNYPILLSKITNVIIYWMTTE